MSIWIKRRFAFADYAADQDRFEQLWQILGHPIDMMMIATGRVSDQTLYARLPSSELAKEFPGWTIISDSELPEAASVLLCVPAEFEKRFKYLSE